MIQLTRFIIFWTPAKKNISLYFHTSSKIVLQCIKPSKYGTFLIKLDSYDRWRSWSDKYYILSWKPGDCGCRHLTFMVQLPAENHQSLMQIIVHFIPRIHASDISNWYRWSLQFCSLEFILGRKSRTCLISNLPPTLLRALFLKSIVAD